MKERDFKGWIVDIVKIPGIIKAIKKSWKDKKEKMAQKAKDAARHARITKGIPFSDAQGSGYIKNGKKVYEKRN